MSAAASTSPAPTAAQATHVHTTQPFLWSVKRELWEHRSIYVAPLAIAALMIVALLVYGSHALVRLPEALAAAPSKRQLFFAAPYSAVALILVITSVFVAFTYCLDALYSERRDRSILFWKSLPVSDTTAVLAKVCIPLIVIPVITFAVATTVHVIMLLVSTVALAIKGTGLSEMWAHLPLVKLPVGLAYFLITLALWYAPVYGWLLMASAWAQRAPLLWAVGPPLALVATESILLRSNLIGHVLGKRLGGGFESAFSASGDVALHFKRGAKAGQAGEDSTQLVDYYPDPTKFFANPELWIGLIIGAVFIAVAIWLRRRRDPV